MGRTIASGMVVLGFLAATGCSGPDPTEPGGGFQLPPDAQKAQDEAGKQSPEQMENMMEKMKKSGGGPGSTKPN